MEEERLDLISRLPVEILHRILSFLPLKMAVRTSVLSILWRSLWMRSHGYLNSTDGLNHQTEEEQVMRFFTKFLSSYQVLNLWRLSHSMPTSNKSFQVEAKCILLATMGANEDLYLDFSVEHKERSFNFFNLKLDFTTCHNLVSSTPTRTAIFASLKTLHLKSVNHLASKMVPAFFSNCQFLESLELVNCWGLTSLHINADNRLKSLTVLECPNMDDITLRAPNLQSFRYRGVLPRFQLKNISNLVDMMLDLRDGPGVSNFDCEELISLLADISHVEIFTLTDWLLESLCTAGVIFECLQIRLNNLKELFWIGNLIDPNKRDSMVCFLSICPFLERLFVDIDPRHKGIPSPLFHNYWHEPHLCKDYATVKAKASRLDHLKVVRMSGFSSNEEELILIDLILHMAVFLKSMIVTSPENHSWQLMKIPSSQVKQRSILQDQKQTISASKEKNKSYNEFIEEDNHMSISLRPVHGNICL